MIGVVGHADLTAPSLKLVEPELLARLEKLVPRQAEGLARAGSGLSTAFARAVRGAGMRLVAVLPSLGQLPVLPPGGDTGAAGEMLMLADRVRLFDYDPAQRHAAVTADEALVRSCRRLLAVWDGSRSTVRDATAHLVAYARARGVPVEVVWPQGANRLAAPGPQP